MFLIFLVIALSTGIRFSVQSTECTFRKSIIDGYTCHLSNQTIRSEADMESISGNHLAGFTNDDVTGITEGNSTILVFPSLIIDRFVNVQTVFLHSSSIRTFNSHITTCRAEQIHLNENKIFSIPSGIFRNCDRLVTLTLSSNEIEDINRNAFVFISRLTSLSLSSNKIQRMNSDVFAPLTSMIMLYLDNNHIETVDTRWFRTMTNLIVLDMNDNNITTWDSNILQNNAKLQILFLSGNRIKTLHGNTFTNLPTLSFLSIGGLIEEIPTFNGMGMLRSLTLSNNVITRVSAGSFRHMTNLTQLLLENNLIETVDFALRDYNHLSRLETLSLMDNRITTLQDNAFSSLVSLNVLNLARNEINVLRANSIRPIITQLNLLDVQDNQIERIERELFVNVTRVVFRANGNICINDNIIVSDFTNHTATPLDRCFNFAHSKMASMFLTVLSLIATSIYWKF